MPSDAFSVILQDASLILRPRAVTEVMAVVEPDESGNIVPGSHPSEGVILVLSDLARLYGHSDSDPEPPVRNRRDMATSRKIGYYAARVLCVPTATLRVLADEVLAQSNLIVLESCVGQRSEGLFSTSVHSQSRPVIEEL